VQSNIVAWHSKREVTNDVTLPTFRPLAIVLKAFDCHALQAEPSVRETRIRQLVEADWKQRCVHDEDDMVTQARMLKLVRSMSQLRDCCLLSVHLDSCPSDVLHMELMDKFH
jgi:hypothetical protein